MKKILKIIVATISVLLLIIIILPFAFKGKIEKKIKEEINKNLRAKVDWTDYGFTLFRSFPDFTIRLNDLSVVGINQFEKDTLVNIPKFFASIDLLSVFKGENYEVNSISMINPKILAKVLKDGSYNWDIVPEEPEDTTEIIEPSVFKMSLKKVNLENAIIIYDDADYNIYTLLEGYDLTFKGDLTDTHTSIKTKSFIQKMTVSYEGIKYFSQAEAELYAEIDADLSEYKFTLKNNELRINQLFLGFEGYFTMPDEGYGMDLKFSAKKTDFKNFLSLVPAIYSKDFKKVETKGTLALSGFAKGLYSDNSNPAFGIDIKVDKAMFRYPDLPKSVENIAIAANINCPTSNMDDMIINISKFHLEMAGNPIDVRLLAKKTVSDPEIDATIKGKVNLGQVKEFYPLEQGDELNGLFAFDITAKGKVSAIEQKKYDDFIATGNLQVSNMNYKTVDFPEGIAISSTNLIFTPKFVELADFKGKMGKSDIAAKGRIDNFIAYWFNKNMLKGSFQTQSVLIDLNEFMAKSTESTSTAKTDTAFKLSVIPVPANIDFILTSNVSQLIYDNMNMRNIKGLIKIEDEKASIENLSMETIGGKLSVNGSYSTQIKDNPKIDFGLSIESFDIQQSFKTFKSLEKFAPITEKTFGTFSTKMKLESSLDATMMPLYNTISGGGLMSTSPILVKGNKLFSMIADELKMDKFRELRVDKTLFNFSFLNGRVNVSPFDVKIGNIRANISGSHGFDQTLNYLIKLEIPKSEFGGAANNVLNSLISKANSKGAKVNVGDIVKVDAIVTGTSKDPKIELGLKGAMDNAIQDLKDKAKDEVEKIKKETEAKLKEQEAKLKAEADKLKKDAEEKLRQEQDKVKAESERLKKEAEDKAKAEIERLKKEAEQKMKDELKKKIKPPF